MSCGSPTPSVSSTLTKHTPLCNATITYFHTHITGSSEVAALTFRRSPGCRSERWQNDRKKSVSSIINDKNQLTRSLTSPIIGSPRIREMALTASCASAPCVSMCTRLERVCDRFSRAWLQWARWVSKHCSTRSSSLCTSSRRRCSSSSKASRAALTQARTCCLFLFAAIYATRGKCYKNRSTIDIWTIEDQYVSTVPGYLILLTISSFSNTCILLIPILFLPSDHN